MNVENTYKIKWQRMFLVKGLPEPLKPADSHLQIFDNYIENTRIRLRKIRQPETKEWTRVLEQIVPFNDNGFAKIKMSQILLSETEYRTFEIFKGREIRKNRYFYDLAGREFEIDIFLGALWGLNIAKLHFETEDKLKNFELPEFSVLEITNDRFFMGESLINKSFADVQAKLSERL